MALKYRGKDPNTDWLPGIPARDLTGADLKELGMKEADINGHLYSQRAEPEKKPKQASGPQETPTAAEEVGVNEGAE